MIAINRFGYEHFIGNLLFGGVQGVPRDKSIENNIQESEEQISITASPNPFTDFSTISLEATTTQKIELSLFNNLGHVLRTESHKVLPGINKVQLSEMERLTSGIYYIQIKNLNSTESSEYIKIVKSE